MVNKLKLASVVMNGHKTQAKIKDIGTILTGRTPSTSDPNNYSAREICFVKPSDLLEEKITTIEDTEFYISQKARTQSVCVPENSVLVTCIGIVGKIGITTKEMAFNQQINAIIPNSGLVSYKYLAYLLSAKRKYLSELANAPVVPILNKTNFGNITLSLHPLSEQKEIAERLDKVQELIALQKEQLKKLDDLIKSRFIDLFGNPITNPKGWPLYALHEIATLNPSRSNMPEHTLVSFIPMDAVSTDGYILYQKSGSYASFKKGFTPFIEGDILFAKITPCMENGKGCIATQLQNQVGFGSTEFHVVRPNSSVNTKFLSFILQSRFFRRIAARHMTGSAGQRRVPISFLETYKIALPPKSLQTQFADFVTKIDSQKGLLTTRLSHLETLYKSLMQEYFG